MKRLLLLALALGLGLALGRVPLAFAHAVLISSAPNAGGIFDPNDPPARVELVFSEEVAPAFSTIRVLDSSSSAVDTGEVQAVNPERTRLAVSLPALPPGAYTVAWEALSAVDGHPSRGSFTFGVGVAEVAPPAGATSELRGPTPASLGARWLTLVGQVLLIGVFTFRFLVWKPTLDPAREQGSRLDLSFARQAVRVGWIGLALVGLGLILTPLAQREAGNLTIATARAWLDTRFGSAWLIRFWLGLGLAFGLADLGLGLKEDVHLGLKGWVWWAGLAFSLALGLTSTLVSHSAALQADRRLAVIGDGAHLLAAGVWAGGLLQLFIATRLTRRLPDPERAWLNRDLVLNFSTLAAVAVGALLVSGGYLAGLHVGTWAALFHTSYGWVLLVKVGLALPAFAIAALNLLVIKPRLAEAAEDSRLAGRLRRHFNRWVLVEAGFALAAVGAAGFLTDFQRGRDAQAFAEQAQAVLVQRADDLTVTLTIEPARWGQPNTFDVYLTGAESQPVSNAREVSLRFTLRDRAVEKSRVTAEPVGDGHYQARGSYFSLVGGVEVEVAVRRPDAYDAFAAFQLETMPDGLIRPRQSLLGWTDRLAASLDQGGGRLTGGLLIAFGLAWAGLALRAARRKADLAYLLLPTLIALWAGGMQIAEAVSLPPAPPSGDPEALAWLAESDAAMNRLMSVRLVRTTRGDDPSGPAFTERIAFQAPDRFHAQMSNGAESVAVGATQYYRKVGEHQWQAQTRAELFVFPDFNLAGQATSARLGKVETLSRRPAQVVTFTVTIARRPVAFTRWIDPETKRIVQEYMDAPGHHMLSVYSDYNAPVAIAAPAPSEVGPTPTAIGP